MRDTEAPLLNVELEGLERIHRGKVRDLFRVGGDLLLVTSDRVSAFDVVMNEGVPGKGRVLNQVSAFWFDQLRNILPNHKLTIDVDAMPDSVRRHARVLRGRSMLARATRPLPVEFVVRGYLAGSGLAEYRGAGSICGVPLPAGLQESSRLPEPILTPTTKEQAGHDRPITFDEMSKILGHERARETKAAALALYRAAHDTAEARGLLLADTKFEFGELDGRLIWIDEALTPDSSRYWAKAAWRPGVAQDPFDKQVLRNYLLGLKDWNKAPPPPPLPASIIATTAERYRETARILMGRDVE
jgi:phosphoribosylaminoimidazole-succinocarboxamide synthase